MKRLRWFLLVTIFMISSFTAFSATAIKVRVDMTVLWGNDLPENVYMFAFLSTKTGEYYNNVPGLSITAKYDSTLQGKNKDQDVTGALVS